MKGLLKITVILSVVVYISYIGASMIKAGKLANSITEQVKLIRSRQISTRR